MQTCRRPLAPQEFDHELLWLLVSLGTFLVLTAWLAFGLPTPQCAFHSLTRLPCPTCGATRAAIQFFHGHFGAALRFNPLAFFFFCSLIVFDFYAFAVLVTRSPRFRIGNLSHGERAFVRGAAILLLAGNWLYLLIARPV